jgi:hypothetical protein
MKGAYILLCLAVWLLYRHFHLKHRAEPRNKFSQPTVTDDEERVTTSTLSNDVITRPVECLKQESTQVSIMPEGNINSQQGWTGQLFPFNVAQLDMM